MAILSLLSSTDSFVFYSDASQAAVPSQLLSQSFLSSAKKDCLKDPWRRTMPGTLGKGLRRHLLYYFGTILGGLSQDFQDFSWERGGL